MSKPISMMICKRKSDGAPAAAADYSKSNQPAGSTHPAPSTRATRSSCRAPPRQKKELAAEEGAGGNEEEAGSVRGSCREEAGGVRGSDCRRSGGDSAAGEGGAQHNQTEWIRRPGHSAHACGARGDFEKCVRVPLWHSDRSTM